MVDPDEAFLAGILHDIGKLLFFDVVPDQYVELCQSYSGLELIEQEKEAFGLTHEDIGLRSSHTWKLAEEIKFAIGYHHRPEKAPVHFETAAVVYLANILEKSESIEADDDQQCPISESVLKRLDLEPQALAILHSDSQQLIAETKQACG